MSYSNVDPILIQLFSQMLFLQNQIVNQAPSYTTPGPLVAALEDFINELGAEIQRQAQ
jgi:hypothetical protein